METITIIVSDNMIEVAQGRAIRARLKWQAPGLEIYIVGAVKVSRRPAVQYHAMSEAQKRHIPLLSLKSYGWL